MGSGQGPGPEANLQPLTTVDAIGDGDVECNASWAFFLRKYHTVLRESCTALQTV